MDGEEEGFAGSEMFIVSVKPFFSVLVVGLCLTLAVLLLSPSSSLFPGASVSSAHQRCALLSLFHYVYVLTSSISLDDHEFESCN